MNVKQKLFFMVQFGGQCQRCSYSKCVRALQFHHKDSSEKDLYSKTGSVSVAELTKHPERFLLLCANCHFEEHDALDSQSRFFTECRHCHEQFRSKQCRQGAGRGFYCSRRCQHAQRLVDAPHSVADRFQKYVKQDGECLVWIGAKTAGLGMLMVTKPDGRHAPRTARQVSHFIRTGSWSPSNLSPSCGNYDCVAFEHLKRRQVTKS